MKRALGRTGLAVNAIGLGAWQLSNQGRPSDEEGIDLICTAVEAGVDLVDTADCYSRDEDDFGHNERLVAAALSRLGRRAEITVATKVGFRRPNGQWVPDARPDRIRRGCEASLERLGLDALPLYQLHSPDPGVPFEDQIGALADLKTAGKILHLGLSNVSPDQLRAAQAITRVESVQNECNPWAQEDLTNGLIAACAATGVAYLPYHPVGGKHAHRDLASRTSLGELGKKYGVSSYCILLNWLLRLGEHVIPIPGATRKSSILDNLTATSFRMDDADVTRVRALGRGNRGGR